MDCKDILTSTLSNQEQDTSFVSDQLNDFEFAEVEQPNPACVINKTTGTLNEEKDLVEQVEEVLKDSPNTVKVCIPRVGASHKMCIYRYNPARVKLRRIPEEAIIDALNKLGVLIPFESHCKDPLLKINKFYLNVFFNTQFVNSI